MAITIDGTSLVFTGTLTVTNFTNAANGVCTLVLTPEGGVGTLPALLQGTPGLPPTFTVGTVTTLSAGQPATFVLNETSAGGAGVASAYTVNVGIPQGAQGEASDIVLGSATDVTGTAADNDIIVVTGTGPTAFEYFPFPFVVLLNPSSFTSISTSGMASATMATLSISAQPFNYIPVILSGAVTMVGTVNTVINVYASLTSTTGHVLAEEYGLSNLATQRMHIGASYGSLVSGSYALVDAGNTAQIVFWAQQTANVSDAWSATNSLMSLTVALVPVGF